MSSRARPHVLAKIAQTLDGRIATRTGASQWITGPVARRDGRRLRGEVDAIVVGVGTVLADDPALTTRVGGLPNPLRVIFDSRLQTPPTARVCSHPDRGTQVLTTPAAPEARLRRLEAAGVTVTRVRSDPGGRVDAADALSVLWANGVRTVLVEGGATVHGTLFDLGLVDRVVVYVAPLVVGGRDSRPAVEGLGAGPLADATRFGALRVDRVGEDLRVIADVEPR